MENGRYGMKRARKQKMGNSKNYHESTYSDTKISCSDFNSADKKLDILPPNTKAEINTFVSSMILMPSPHAFYGSLPNLQSYLLLMPNLCHLQTSC